MPYCYLFLQKQSTNKRILIWGEAGIGKTTCASKLVQDWAVVVKQREDIGMLTEEQSHLLSNIGLILFIMARNTNSDQSLDEIVQIQVLNAVGETSLKVSDMKYQNDILLVLDGLDEISYDESQLLDTIEGKIYAKLRCIVLCRPHAALGMSLAADTEIRLKGFSRKQSRHYVDMYFGQKHHSDSKKAEKESKNLWKEIESSSDLLEMAINPSMLQLLCKLFAATGKIAKDRANIFKDYTTYLLQQYNIKIHNKESSEIVLNKVYKDLLFKAGELALQGLKQSHLQLVFTKEVVETLAGKDVSKLFDIGFVTEFPAIGDEKPKVQFQHKTHQEYLAAFFIVNSSDDVGMKYLMEFCSTSKGLMGSQIILTFIIAMSGKMGKVIQKQIRELVSSWASDDDISPKDRTSFLLTMLKENTSLVFPLPREIDMDLREYEATVSFFQKMLHMFGRQSAPERFFGLYNGGVQQLSLILGKENGLEILKPFQKSSLQQVSLDFQNKVSKDDPNHLKDLIEGNINLEIISMTKLPCQGIFEIFTKRELINSMDRAKHLKKINIYDCQQNIEAKTAEALMQIPSHVELDISGNRFLDKSVYKMLIQNAEHFKSLKMRDCSIEIDPEIAQAISELPEQANLDLSGNTIAKVDSSLLCHVIPVVSNKKIDLSGLGVVIDTRVAQAIYSLDEDVDVDISGSQILDATASIILIQKAASMKSLNVQDCMNNCGIHIDQQVAEAMSRLPDETDLDLSGNLVTDKSACITLIHKAATIKSISMCDCGIIIDSEIAEAISQLPQQANLDLSGNRVTKMDSSLLCCVIPVMRHKKIDLSGLGIVIDEDVVKALNHLEDNLEIDLSGNKVTDKYVCNSLICRAATMKSLNICNCFSNCGIQIDAQIAEAVCTLPDETELNLSGNNVTDKAVFITLLHKAVTMKALTANNCGIDIDIEIAEAVSRLPDHTHLDLAGNQVTDRSACITLIRKAATMNFLDIHNCMSNCGIRIDTEIAEAVSRLPDHTQLDLSGNLVQDTTVSIILIQKAATMKSLKLCNCGIQFDTEIADAVSRLPEQAELDLSGNQIKDKSVCVTLIHKAATMKCLWMCNCGIQIDTEIAEAISQLPESANLDLSGNTVTKMDSSLLCHVIPVISNKKIDLSGLGMCIDADVAHTLCSFGKEVEKDLSGNHIAEKSVCTTLILQGATSQPLGLSKCGIVIDTEIAKAVSQLPKHANLDLSGNTVTKMDSSLLCHVIPVISNQKIDLSGLGVVIDGKVANAINCLNDSVEIDLSDNHVANKSDCITLIHKAATMKSLNIHNIMRNCGILIDQDIAEAISRLPDDTELDMSFNQVAEKSVSLTIIRKSASMKFLSLCNCGIQIDTEIAEAISQLPEQVSLDLSGNTVTKMDSSLLCHVIPVIRHKKIDLSGLGVNIDTKLAKALCCVNEEAEVDLSSNHVVDTSACLTLIHKAVTMKALNVCNCGIDINREIAEAVSRLPNHAKLDLSGNQITDKSICIALIQKAASMKSLSICNCGIQIDTEIAETVSRLPDETELDLSGNKVTDNSVCSTLIHKAATMKFLSLCNCGIKIDTEIAEAVSSLPDHVELDLSDNRVTDKPASIILLHKAESMKSLNIHNCLCNCGMKIDKEIAEAICNLPDQTEFDLSGNHITDKHVCVTLIHKAATMKYLNLSKCGIQLDVDIAKAVSTLPDQTTLELSGNNTKVMGSKLLSKLLLCTTRDTALHLEECGITVDVDLVKTFAKLTQLQGLVINFFRRKNKLTSAAAAEFPETIKHLPQLKRFFLDECSISDDVMVALTGSLCKHCPLLEQLSLSENRLSSSVWKVLSHIGQMRKLKRLWLDGNPCMKDSDLRSEIRTALHKSNPTLDQLTLLK